MNPNEPWAQSASELSASIRLKRISCVEVVEAALQRIADVNSDVNAIVEILGEQALEQARRHDSALAGDNPRLGPLFGVPFTAKINVDVAGLATTNGVAAFSDLVANADNPCIRNLRDAGGICIGRTNVPAFSALVLPISLGSPVPIDADQNGDMAVHDMLDAYRPLTAISLLGFPSLAVPCGMIDGLPQGVQIVSGRYQEETCLRVGEIIASYQPAIDPIDPLLA